MSDMKCPICGKDLVEIELGECWFLTCCNSECRCKGVASGIVWEYLTVAIKNRQALSKEFICTYKELKQSQTCCSEWEKQALDYKSENNALSIKLEFVVDTLKEIDKLLSSNKFNVNECPLLNITQTKISMLLKCINIEQK